MGQGAPRPLPVVLPPCAGELLSSWIARHAAFYAVSPRIMLQHCLPDAKSLRSVDLRLSDEQAAKLDHLFSTETAFIQRMTFSNIQSSFLPFLATRPAQGCRRCGIEDAGTAPILRSQFFRWRIACKTRGDMIMDQDTDGRCSTFRHYETAALRGQKLIDDEVEHGERNWTPPTCIARLLLLRRFPESVFCRDKPGLFRVLGTVIAELDDVLRCEQAMLPSPACLVLPLHFRHAWLAGVAMVERAGPRCSACCKTG